MATTWFEQGVEQGWQQGFEQGRQQGERNALRCVLEEQYGPLSPRAQERLASWPADRLVELVRSILRSQSLREMGLEE
jgi:hypothetical protein